MNTDWQASEIPEALCRLIRPHVPMRLHTSLRVGGPATWLATPRSGDELVAAMDWVVAREIPWFTLGRGTNVIFDETGYRGLVFDLSELTGLHLDGATVRVMAGQSLPSLVQEVSRRGLAGLEWACGIPGSIGGAVVMNAGAFGQDLASILSSIRLLQEDGIRVVEAEELALGYRTSRLRTGELRGIVLEATLALMEGDSSACMARIEHFTTLRAKSQPQGASCGSVFVNPAEGPTAGQLLDRAGCKGLRIGCVEVSHLHANFIINYGENNANDILELIEQMHDAVLRTSGISLQREICMASSSEIR